MEQSRRVGDAKQEHGQEARLQISLADKGRAHAARVGDEALDLGVFLRRAFHRLHAVERLGEMRVHRPEGAAHRVGNGRKRLQVVDEREKVGNRKNNGNQPQVRVDARAGVERDDQEEERSDDEVQSRAEHEVHFAHVVGGARHRVAHRLEVVEGHALAEQGQVQFVADVALDALRHQFRAEVAPELQHAAYHLRNADGQRQRDQHIQARRDGQHVVESLSHVGGHDSRQRAVAIRADQHEDDDRPVARRVGNHPAHGAGAV